MRALPVDETECAPEVLVQNEIFTEQADRLNRPPVELRERRDRHPIPAQQLAHRRAGTDSREPLVVLLREHYFPPSFRSAFVLIECPSGKRPYYTFAYAPYICSSIH